MTTQRDSTGPGSARPFQDAALGAVVLASASPTRAALLRSAGLEIERRPAAVDEAAVKEALQSDGVAPGDAAVALAEMKAQRIAAEAPSAAVVLGADQILTCDGRWFDKPADIADARRQLADLAGRRHELWTAAVGFRGSARVWHHLAETRLWMRPCSAAFLDRYVEAVGETTLASGGAYQIEGLGAHLFAGVRGDHFAILGLPLLEVLEFLRTQGVVMR